MYDEWSQRKFNKARLQTEAPGYLDNTKDITVGRERFGIFGKHGGHTDPDGQGNELYEEDMEDEKYEPLLDTQDVKVFHSQPNVYYEERNEKKLETQSNVLHHQQLYDALKRDCKMLSESMEQMCQMREMTERDAYQIENEQKLELGNRFEIPPKTLPGDVDMEPMHDRHGRLVLLRRRISDIQYSINKTDERKRLAEGQMLTLAKKIAVGKDLSKQQEAELKSINGPMGMIPVVIGHSLQRVKGLDVHSANPREFLQAVTTQSRYIELKEMGKVVQKVFRDRNSLDQTMWITHQGDTSPPDFSTPYPTTNPTLNHNNS